MKRSIKTIALLAIVAWLGTVEAFAVDTLKLAIGQRGKWDGAVPDLGSRAGIFKKHGLEPRDALYQRRRRDHAGGDLGQRRHRHERRNARRAGRFRQGRAHPHHQRAGDRRRRLLVRARGLADQVHGRHEGPDHGLFHHRLIHQLQRPRPDRSLQGRGEAGGDRRPGADVHASHVGPDRRRLVGAAVRHRGAAQGRNPGHRARDRSSRGQGPHRAGQCRQCPEIRNASARSSPAT